MIDSCFNDVESYIGRMATVVLLIVGLMMLQAVLGRMEIV